MIELSKRNKLEKKHSDQLQIKYFVNQKGFVYVWKKLDNELKQKEESLIDAITE